MIDPRNMRARYHPPGGSLANHTGVNFDQHKQTVRNAYWLGYMCGGLTGASIAVAIALMIYGA